MLVSFLILLREGIEAALIVGIIAGYLRQTGRAAWMPLVWIGVAAAALLSLGAGIGLELLGSEFPQREQELFEAVVGLIAVGVLTSMVFWMRRAARNVKGQLHNQIDTAVGDGSGMALIGMVFLAVMREGLEAVFFLLAVFQQSTGWSGAGGCAGWAAGRQRRGIRDLLGWRADQPGAVLPLDRGLHSGRRSRAIGRVGSFIA